MQTFCEGWTSFHPCLVFHDNCDNTLFLIIHAFFFLFVEKNFTIILFLYCINNILFLTLLSQKNKLRMDSGQRCPSPENFQIKQLRWSAIQGFLKKKICKSRGFPITKNNKNRDFCCCYLWQEKYVYTYLSVCHKHGGINVLDGFSITWGEAGDQDIQEKYIKCLCRLTQCFLWVPQMKRFLVFISLYKEQKFKTM